MHSAAGGGAPQPNMDMVLTTAEEIASGMAFLHSQGIVHGDLTGGAHRGLGRAFQGTCGCRACGVWRSGSHAADALPADAGNILLTSWPANRHGFCAKIAGAHPGVLGARPAAGRLLAAWR
jgi:hypothetical protein